MGGKTTVLAGLLAGAIAGAVIVGAAVALLPPLPEPVLATPTPAPTASPTPIPSPPASASPGTSASPSSSASPVASASAQASAGDSGSTGSLFGIGAPAPALALSTTGGGTVDLLKLRGRPVWVNFMATWCPSCRDELPFMSAFAARYAKDGLEVVIVDVREPAAAVSGYMASLGVRLPVGLDTNGVALAAWKAIALPVHYWVDRDGIVRAGAVGSVGPDLMATNLQAILPGVTVTP